MFYHQRRTAEEHIGELVREAAPSLRAVTRGDIPRSVTILDNNAALVLAALVYALVHHIRRGLEKNLNEGWSIGRVKERLPKAAASIVRHARQVVFRLCPTKIALWEAIAEVICPIKQPALEVAR